MKTFYVTFGQKYRREPNPRGVAHPDGYLTVHAINENVARNLTIHYYGLLWSNIYTEGEFDKTLYHLGSLRTLP